MKGAWDSDRDPLSALRQGDAALFEAFVAAETRTFLGFFRRMGAPPAEAEDLVQELFFKLFQHAETYRPSGRFVAFAFRVARNAWIDRMRRHDGAPSARTREDARSFDANATTAEASPSERLEQLEEGSRVQRALAQIPEHHRLVFELGVMQELPYGEISALLEIPEGTVKSRMHYAVRRLRELLEGARSGSKQRSAS